MLTLKNGGQPADADDTSEGRGPGFRRFLPRFRDTIAARVLSVVLITGAIGFGLIGAFTVFTLQRQLGEQATALGRLSNEQMVTRLDGEAIIARSRLEALGANVTHALRQVSLRPDIIRAVASDNNITVRETLRGATQGTEIQRVIAFDAKGFVIGADVPVDLLELQMIVSGTRIAAGMRVLLNENSRAKPRGLGYSHRLSPALISVLALENRPMLAFVAVEPVFDDFGEVIGALAAIRPLALRERSLEQFSSLDNAGIAIMQRNELLASAGSNFARFDTALLTETELLRSDDGRFVARCAPYDNDVRICTYTDASAVDVAKNQMAEIGSQHGRQQLRQLITFSGLAMLLMILGLAYALHRITHGLTPLANAARAIASGNLDTPFRAGGDAEILRLGKAFEKMLANLRASTAQIRMLAFYDGVTQLANREKMLIDAPLAISSSGTGAMLFLDLDGFKAVNDTFGHKAGDLLLSKVADRFLALLENMQFGRQPLLSRLGGDEFALLLPGIDTQEAAAEFAEHMINCLRAPFTLNGNTAKVGASVGIALYPASGTQYEQLLMNADMAMYSAKNAGRNTYAFFNEKLAFDAMERRQIEADLMEAIRNEQLSVNYQPKVLCTNGQIRGVEALARWYHPERGPISPGIFIKMAEEGGVIRDLGKVILKKSLLEMGRLIEAGHDLVMSVNVTAVDIEDPKFARDVMRLLAETRYPPGRLELEITESIAASNATVVRERMNVLRQLGVRFSMDDFGAGYSNLATVARLPFDAIKIDRSLVHGVSEDPERQSILRVAIGLASELGFDTVVEGVEEPADMTIATDFGATYVQGYIFSPPVSIEKFTALLEPGCLVNKLPKSSRPQAKSGAKRTA